jgi:plasmid stability protein
MKDIKTSLMIPENVWKAAKIRAAQEGISMGELNRNAIKEYLAKGKPIKKGS